MLDQANVSENVVTIIEFTHFTRFLMTISLHYGITFVGGGDDEDSEFEKLGTSELLAPLVRVLINYMRHYVVQFGLRSQSVDISFSSVLKLITAGCTSIGLLVFFWPTFMGLIR